MAYHFTKPDPKRAKAEAIEGAVAKKPVVPSPVILPPPPVVKVVPVPEVIPPETFADMALRVAALETLAHKTELRLSAVEPPHSVFDARLTALEILARASAADVYARAVEMAARISPLKK